VFSVDFRKKPTSSCVQKNLKWSSQSLINAVLFCYAAAVQSPNKKQKIQSTEAPNALAQLYIWCTVKNWTTTYCGVALTKPQFLFNLKWFRMMKPSHQ